MQTPKRLVQIQQNITNFNQKCVCQICTCGKHHCPPKSTKFVGETTNHHDYQPFHITAQKQQRCEYKIPQRHYDPEALKSSYRKDYENYKIQPQLNPSKVAYKKNGGKFYDQTQYSKNYLSHPITIERPSTHNPQIYKSRRFQGKSTYQEQYSPKRMQKVNQVTPHYERKNIPFTGQSSYNTQFVPYNIQVHKQHQCPERPIRRENTFMGESRYHQDFKQYHIQQQRHCPIEEMPVRPLHCSPGKSHLNYSAQKRTWQ